jgi:hypothetical protein
VKDRILTRIGSLFHYEVPGDPSGGVGVVEPAVDPADLGEEQPWTGPSQEDWQNVTETLGYLAQFAQSQQQPSEEEGYPEIDPYDPQQLGEFIQQQVGQALTPYQEHLQSQQQAEHQELLHDVIADDITRNGDIMMGQKAYPLIIGRAREMFPEYAQRYGQTNKAAEEAMQQAVSEWRAWEQELAQKAIDQHMNQLTNLSGAGREPQAGNVGAQGVVTTPGGDEMSVVRKYGVTGIR